LKNIHKIVIDKFGGSKGIRDRGTLESALSRTFQTFDEKDLYPLPIEKAAAIFESIIINHPFVDGNKRTAYILMRLILLQNGIDITASENEKYDFVIGAASGEIRFNEIKEWLLTNTKSIT
jgi:death on curing protein